jgi:hypothetical protein
LSATIWSVTEAGSTPHCLLGPDLLKLAHVEILPANLGSAFEEQRNEKSRERLWGEVG